MEPSREGVEDPWLFARVSLLAVHFDFAFLSIQTRFEDIYVQSKPRLVQLLHIGFCSSHCNEAGQLSLVNVLLDDEDNRPRIKCTMKFSRTLLLRDASCSWHIHF